MLKQILTATIAVALVNGQTLVNGPKPAGPRLVLVDVQVTGDKGPVRDLKPDNFVLEDSGKKQTLALFDLTASGKQHQTPVPLPRGVYGNRMNAKGEMPTAATVMLYDRVNSDAGDQAFVRPQILRVLADLKPTDKLGFYSLGLQGLRMVTDYDDDAAMLSKVAKALLKDNDAPTEFTPQETAMFKSLFDALQPTQPLQNQARVNITYPTFEAVGRHMAGVLGKKNLIWITSVFPLTYGNSQERRQQDQKEVEKFTRYLTENNISIFPIDPSGSGNAFGQGGGAPTSNEGSLMSGTMRNSSNTSSFGNTDSSLTGTQTMLILADATGGKAYRNVNDIAPPLKEVLESSEYSYTLGFYPDAHSLDGRNRDIKVSLKDVKEKAKLSFRKKYWAWGPTMAADEQNIPTLQTVIEGVISATQIGLLATAQPQGAGNTVLDVKISAGDLRFDPTAGDKWSASFSVVVIPDSGQPVAKDYSPSFSEADLKHVVAEGVDLREVVQTGAKPGSFRIAIVDKKSGLAGSLVVPYDVAAK